MLAVTGDVHNNPEFLVNRKKLIKLKNRNDVLIILGDAGFSEQTKIDKLILDYIEKSIQFSIAFVLGNHENFDYLAQCPTETRYNGPVKVLRPNIVCLQNGYVYEISGHRVFAFGGALSIDKARRITYQKATGIKTYFEQELPTSKDYELAIKTLKAHNNKIDIIATHAAPLSFARQLSGEPPHTKELELLGFLDYLYYDIIYKYFFCGHYHIDKKIGEVTCCYKDVHILD